MWAFSTEDPKGTAAASLLGITEQKSLSPQSILKELEPTPQRERGQYSKACPPATCPAQRSFFGNGAHQYLFQDQPALQSSCVLPRTVNPSAKCDPSSRLSAQKRALDEDWDPTPPSDQQRPSIGFMLSELLDNRFTFQ